MKCLSLEAYGRFEIVEKPRPAPGPTEVLLQVQACGICGSDIHGMDGSTGRRIPPIVMGHEAAGTVVEVGAAVSGWTIGDRVTFDSTVYCGACSYCRAGRINLCDRRQVLGVSCGEYRRDGAFAEYVVVPHHILYRLPDDVTFVQAAMVEPVSVAVHAVSRPTIRLHDSAVVVGAGMIGLLVIQTLRAAGIGTIWAVDLDDNRLKLAAELGADVCLRADRDDVVAEVKARSDGLGAHHAFEVVGATSTLLTALRSIRKGGTLTLVGNVSPMVELPLQEAVTREIAIYGSCASAGEYPVCLSLIERGLIEVDPLISAVATLDDGAQWFHRLYGREPGLMKVVLCPSGEQPHDLIIL